MPRRLVDSITASNDRKLITYEEGTPPLTSLAFAFEIWMVNARVFMG